MKNQYKDKEKRKAYLKNWREKNRKHCNEYLREYLSKINRRKYYSPKNTNNVEIEGFYGRCGLGRKYEKIALSLLPNSIDNNKESFSGDYDIIWQEKRIDVKMRNKSKEQFSWTFNTAIKKNRDYFLLFCVEEEKIKKIFLIPSNKLKISTYITENNNKWDKYKLVVH